MAIDLPPALPPQLSSVEAVQQYAASSAADAGKVAGFDLRVSGSHYLSGEELQQIFNTARTPSQAVRMINAGAVRKGHMLVTTLYAQRGNTIYVHAIQGQLTDVSGPAAVAKAFQPLKGDADLTRSEFDRARIMAEVNADRFNADYSASFQMSPSNPGSVSMLISPVQGSSEDPTDLVIGLNNEGNRFFGRYMGNVGMNHTFNSGTHISAVYQTALTDLDEGDVAGEYKGGEVALSQPFSWGTVDLSHQEITFEGKPSVFIANPFESTIRVTALASDQIASAGQTHRLVSFQRLEKVNTEVEDSAANVDTADEEYLTLELGANFYSLFGLMNKPFRWSVGVSVEAGLGDNDGTLRSDTSPAGVDETKRDAEFITLKANAAFKYAFSDSGLYWGGNFFTQQTDVQLPLWEQFATGGQGELAAYLPGALVGDSGTLMSTELGWDSEGDGYTMNVAVFLEHGVTNFEDASGSDGDDRSLTDVGVKVSADIGKRFNIAAVVAEGIQDDGFTSGELDDLESDFYFSTKLRF